MFRDKEKYSGALPVVSLVNQLEIHKPKTMTKETRSAAKESVYLPGISQCNINLHALYERYDRKRIVSEQFWTHCCQRREQDTVVVGPIIIVIPSWSLR